MTEQPARIQAVAAARFTAAEFVQMLDAGAFAGMSVELDRGEIVRMAPANMPHTVALDAVLMQLKAAVSDNQKAFGEPSVLLTDDTLREPDVCVFDAAVVRERLATSAFAQIVVEVSDTTLSYDLGVKCADYATATVPEYWVVDLAAKVTHVMTDPAPDGYRTRRVVAFGQPLSSPRLTAPVIVAIG